jgi:hypothetical protein
MKSRGFVAAAIMIAAIVAGFAFSVPATSARASKPPVVWIDLAGGAKEHPGFIYFTANSGSQVRKVKWKGWGRKRAVGRGTYRVTSPPPPGGNPKGPARIVAWKPFNCVPEFGNREGRTVRVYRHAKMLRPVSGGGRKWVDISDFTGRLTCR